MSESNRGGRLGRRRIIVIVLAVLLLIGIVWLGLTLKRAWTAASSVRAAVAALELPSEGGGQSFDIEGTIELFRKTRADLVALRNVARPFLWLAPHLGWIPRCGHDVEAIPALFEVALHLTAAGEEVVEPLALLMEQAAGDGTSADTGLLEEAVTVLASARPQLEAARAHVRQAQAARERLAVEELHPRVQGWVRRLDRYLPSLERGVEVALLAPDLLGGNGARSYIVLVQNEDELRPTGGFISSVVQLTLENGRIVTLQFEDSYAVDDFSRSYPEPPEPLQTYMLADLWVFRDSNWSPDFPTSAQRAIDLYTISRDVEPSGVVALDQEAIRLLVDALGPLQVEGYPESIHGGNVIQAAREAWSPGEEIETGWWAHRKDFMAVVLDVAIRRMESGLDRERSLRLAQGLLQALRRKHLLVYLEDREASIAVEELGWGGAQVRRAGDYLMVVDANVGFNKVNSLVEEELTYEVDLTDPEHPRATLVIRHRHPLENWQGPCRQRPRYDATYEQMMERCYWDYLRVYVPAESGLLNATPHRVPGAVLLSGQPSPAEVAVKQAETGHDYFATFLLVPPGKTIETRFEYVLPKGMLQGQAGEYVYDLLVQKQPGTRAIPLRVEVMLPAGAVVEASDPESMAMVGANLVYVSRLETDQMITIVFRWP